MIFSLYNFKNFSDRRLELSENLQVLVGDNGSGKSTLCEGLSILVNAANPHHTSWEHKSCFGETSGSWALRLNFENELFQVIFGEGFKSPKWYIGDTSISKPKYEQAMPYRVFWITSDHLRIITGEPSERRNFLDEMLGFASASYHHVVSKYRTAIISRNRVIESIQEKKAAVSDLLPWDTLLAEYAIGVIHERKKFFAWRNKKERNNLGASLHLPGDVDIALAVRHPLTEDTKESFIALLESYKARDLVVGRTTVGPHLDDIEFQVTLGGKKQSTKYVLSRGENKILLLSFVYILGEYIAEQSGKKPLFLLDDVLSELDGEHIHVLCDLFRDSLTIMTTQPNHVSGLPIFVEQNIF